MKAFDRAVLAQRLKDAGLAQCDIDMLFNDARDPNDFKSVEISAREFISPIADPILKVMKQFSINLVLSENQIDFINGIFFCVHTGHIDQEQFWEIISETEFDKAQVQKSVMPNMESDIQEALENWEKEQ